MTAFIGNIQQRQTHRNRKQIGGGQGPWKGLGGGWGGVTTAKEHSVSFQADKYVLKPDSGDACATSE